MNAMLYNTNDSFILYFTHKLHKIIRVEKNKYTICTC